MIRTASKLCCGSGLTLFHQGLESSFIGRSVGLIDAALFQQVARENMVDLPVSLIEETAERRDAGNASFLELDVQSQRAAIGVLDAGDLPDRLRHTGALTETAHLRGV